MNANPYSLGSYPTSVRTAVWGTCNIIAGEQDEIVSAKKVIQRTTTFDEVEMHVQAAEPSSLSRKAISERTYVTLRVVGENKWKSIPLFAFRKPMLISLDTLQVGQEIELIFTTTCNHKVLVTTAWKGKEAY